MSQACNNDQFLLDTTPSGLQTLRDTSLLLIRKHFFADADIVNNLTTVNFPVTQSFHQTQTMLPDEVIIEVEKGDFDQFTQQDNRGVKGAYVPMYGKTFLIKNMWCIETMIHETLHSCSRFSTDIYLAKYGNWIEGLTEFLTGYIIFKEFQDCYTNCFLPKGQLCEITYGNYVKLWAGFCNFISIKKTIPIYFPTEKKLETEIDELVKIVHKQGFENFKTPLDSSKASTDFKFKNQCENAFGKKFKLIYKKRNLWTDFSKIKDD